jgi:L-aminopeptidase/D-esterase-like protein
MSIRPGPRNLITDVAGLMVGSADAPAQRTGATVILPTQRAVCAVDVRGGAPGTRETDALAADTLVEAVDGVVLSGGSVYGLAAADGVATWLGAQGRGFGLSTAPGVPKAPVVPCAILYDLGNGGDKGWGDHPPYRQLGVAAAKAAGLDFALGTSGAGLGAMAGTLKGGLGSASAVTADGFTVGALVAVNSFGAVVAPGGRRFWAGAFEIGDEFGGQGAPDRTVDGADWGEAKLHPGPRENTTIACVATDADLTPSEARRLAVMAQDGLSRAIRPVHTPFDGDVVFALATAQRPLGEARAFDLTRLGALAADCLARAVARGVFAARPWAGAQVRTWREL